MMMRALLFALLAALLLPVQAQAQSRFDMCRTEVPLSGGGTIAATRSLDDGKYSTQIAISSSGSNAGLSYIWGFTPKSLSRYAPILQVDFEDFGYKKFRKGSRLRLIGDGGRTWVLARRYEEGWYKNFDIVPDELFAHFATEQRLQIELHLLRDGVMDAKSVLLKGSIDLQKLRQELEALQQADRQLDSMQADYPKLCASPAYGSADYADWDCGAVVKDSYGEQLFDDTRIFSRIKVGKLGELYIGADLPSAEQRDAFVERGWAGVEARGINPTLIFYPKSERLMAGLFTLKLTTTDDLIEARSEERTQALQVWERFVQMAASSKDITAELFDAKGKSVGKAILPAGFLATTEASLRASQIQSAANRRSPDVLCEEPQPIVVT